jgi:hypothetical protein
MRNELLNVLSINIGSVHAAKQFFNTAQPIEGFAKL